MALEKITGVNVLIIGYNYLIAVIFHRKECNYLIVRTLGIKLHLAVLIGYSQGLGRRLSGIYSLSV